MARGRKAAACPKGSGRGSVAQANALLRAVEGMFHRRDIGALVNGFTPDCRFHFAEQPPQRGRPALRRFFTARLSRQDGYRLRKSLLALEGNRLANLWEGRWTDAKTGTRMRGRGLEV